METEPVNERKQFILEATGSFFTHTELCCRYGISRKTGYKWLNRYLVEGPDGLADRSHTTHSCPHTTEPHVIEVALKLRKRWMSWGAGKIRARLLTLHPDWHIPSAQVLHKYFEREGLVKKRRRSRKRPHPGRPTAPFDAPNSIWSADFKGEFKTLDGLYCYPLTIQDGFSRYLLACQGLAGPTYAGSRPVFTRLFREFGLPDRIRTDNGTPFASVALGRLSRLSIWWIKLGILPDLIEPASPYQNGRHERMHRDLKAEATIPPAGNRIAQQRRFNRFRREFNKIRPHEAHDQQPPATVYTPSTRPFPKKIQMPEYPEHYEVRRVSKNGGIRWHSAWVNVSHLLGGEYVGLEEVADDIWSVYFGSVSLGWLHVRKGAILDHDGTMSRRPKL
jgi:transposase InsO family protein